MTKTLSILFFGAGALVALGIFFPRFRPHWKGSRISCGVLGCAGFSLAFMSLGVSRFFSDSLSERQRTGFAWLFIAGWVIAVIGFVLDWRRSRRAEVMQHLQTHLIMKERGDHAA
jgi:hypothetical protein